MSPRSLTFSVLCFASLWTFSLRVAFSQQEPDFPELRNTQRGNEVLMTPQEALAKVTLPDGFSANLYAHEPEINNPIGINFDERGRMWVAENYTYAWPEFDLTHKDRIVIVNDTNGDGVADERKVFTDQLQILTSALPGRGGVWVMCPPQLLFIPDANRDDVPDGPPVVVLDGFHLPASNYHNMANGLKWGPDGWLYGRCGASCPGDIGAPGTALDRRIPLRGGMWRYHVDRGVFETIASGTTNPWGHDWNEFGDLFYINTVGGHLWHVITGAHFLRSHTLDPHPRVYQAMDQHADHHHFDTGLGWRAARTGVIYEHGGGHAHAGLMVYQGNNWPAAYRNQVYALNLYGRRINQDLLVPEGSGYVGKHAPDMVFFGDPWFRGMDLTSGPDGAVYLSDWSDTGECHEHDGVHRTSGRIYRIAHRDAPPVDVPAATLDTLSSTRLAELLAHDNIWHSRSAAQLLVERHHAGTLNAPGLPAQLDALIRGTATPVRLRALWLKWQLGADMNAQLKSLLTDTDERIRGWAIRLLSDSWPIDTVTGLRPPRPEPTRDAQLLATFNNLARTSTSPIVRLQLATVLQRLPHEQRSQIAAGLGIHPEDQQDHNLPLMIWYGLAPLDAPRLMDVERVAEASKVPLLQQLIARRLTEEIETTPGPLDRLLAVGLAQSEAGQLAILTGMSQGLAGWSKATPPRAWNQFASRLPQTEAHQALARELGVVFGDGRALAEVKALALSETADLASRKRALASLIDSNDPDLRDICARLLRTMYLNTLAAQGLAKLADDRVPERVLGSWQLFATQDRPQVVSVLVSRPNWAKELLAAIGDGRVARNELSAFQARQIQDFGDPALSAQLRQVWGELRDTDADKLAQIVLLKSQLDPGLLAQANLSHGRALFNKTCAACHTLYGEGGKRGPDITGSQRFNIDYLLMNVIDPSQSVPAEFRASQFELADGRVLTGMIGARTDRTVTILTPTEELTIERSAIVQTRESALSLMPDGLLNNLSDAEQRDLLAYLMHDRQVPLE